jgi:hypothetical protein
VLTTVWGMSSRLVQVTVVPTRTVSVSGPKLKLSILTSAFAAAAWRESFLFQRPDSFHKKSGKVRNAFESGLAPPLMYNGHSCPLSAVFEVDLAVSAEGG